MEEAAFEMPVSYLSIVSNKIFIKVKKISLTPVCRENCGPYGLSVQAQLGPFYFQKMQRFFVVFPLC